MEPDGASWGGTGTEKVDVRRDVDVERGEETTSLEGCVGGGEDGWWW